LTVNGFLERMRALVGEKPATAEEQRLF
jgi:hypothetical protein